MDDHEFGANEHGELAAGCRKCGVMYASATELKLHFATAHSRQTFECFVCNKLYMQKFYFLAHIDKYHEELSKNFSCQYCDKVYTTRPALDEHIGQSHRSPLIICPMCQKSLPSGQSLKKHVSSCHYQLSQAVAAQATSSASQQIKQESSTGETSYDCFPCQKAYKTQSGLAFHIKTKHQDTEHKCEYCGKSFSRPSNVQRHIETIHTMTKSFPCKHCGQDFRSTGGRDMHINAEHKGLRFDCSLCMRQFKRKGSLDRHISSMHAKTCTVFKCNTCRKEFKQKSHLKTHLKNVHNQDLILASAASAATSIKAQLSQPQQSQVQQHTSLFKPVAGPSSHYHHMPVFPQNLC